MRRPDVIPLQHVQVAPLPIERFAEVLTAEQEDGRERTVERAQQSLAGRVVWNVNSTAFGGGVAEMLRSLIAYSRAAGVDARWVVMGGEPDFFRITKRMHNNLHGHEGDGGPLGDAERAIYEGVAAANTEQLAPLVRPGDIVLAHDPQTAGLVQPLVDLGAHVIWRAHIGLDLPNDRARAAWSFLLPYVSPAAAYVFSREAYVWEGLDAARVQVIRPSIDPFSAKNQQLLEPQVRAILQAAGVVAEGSAGDPTYERHDGSTGRVDRRARMVEQAPLEADASVVTQVSRWDHLKDPLGVMEGFARHVDHGTNAHLVLAGPEPTAVTDDPEGADVLSSCVAAWERLAPEARERIHLALLPMADAEENAVIVNALQRWSSVVVQKSLAEGFGLTVAEAMWKARPVVASRVGGIQDQIADGESGVLVDAGDLAGFGAAVSGLLADRDRAERMGAAAQARVRGEFLGVRHLTEYVDLFGRLMRSAETKGAETKTAVA
ncbi:MAG: trehalose synthase [Thermoleophilaceae bacterium]|nr:trehalose synthase [Thermoleophilaceae bacterium]